MYSNYKDISNIDVLYYFPPESINDICERGRSPIGPKFPLSGSNGEFNKIGLEILLDYGSYYRRPLSNSVEIGHVAYAFFDGKSVGYINFTRYNDRDYILLDSMVVVEDQRRKGIGRELIRFVSDVARVHEKKLQISAIVGTEYFYTNVIRSLFDYQDFKMPDILREYYRILIPLEKINTLKSFEVDPKAGHETKQAQAPALTTNNNRNKPRG